MTTNSAGEGWRVESNIVTAVLSFALRSLGTKRPECEHTKSNYDVVLS